MYKTNPQDRIKVRGTSHGVEVGTYDAGLAIRLEGDGVNWETSMPWSDWERIIAFVEWRRKEAAAS